GIVFVWRLTRQSEVVVGYVADGRNQPELSDAQGLFRRVLPVSCGIDAEMPFSTVLEEVAAAVDVATRYQDYVPVADATSAEPGLGFVWDEWPAPEEGAGVRIELTRLDARTEPSKLQLVCTSRNEDWQVELRYSAGSYDRPDRK